MKKLAYAFVLLAATFIAQAQNPPPVPPAPGASTPRPLPPAFTNRCMLLVNAAGLSDEQMESLRVFAAKDLWIRVEAVKAEADWASLPGRMAGFFTSNRVVVVALAKGTSAGDRIVAAPDNGWAVVNVAPALELKDKQDQILKQQMMRGVGRAVGVATCLDKYCCVRTSKFMADLADAGNNFCPVTRKEYQNLAVQRGLFPLNPVRRVIRKPASAPATVPAPAPAVKAEEKK